MDAEKLKNEADEERSEKGRMENQLIDVMEKLKVLEDDKDKFYGLFYSANVLSEKKK